MGASLRQALLVCLVWRMRCETAMKPRLQSLFVDGAKSTFLDVADGARATFSEVADAMSRRADAVRGATTAAAPAVREATVAARDAASELADATSSAWSRLTSRPSEEDDHVPESTVEKAVEEAFVKNMENQAGDEETLAKSSNARRLAAVATTVASTTGLLSINANFRDAVMLGRKELSSPDVTSDLSGKPYIAPIDMSAGRVLPPKRTSPPPPKKASPQPVEPEKKTQPDLPQPEKVQAPPPAPPPPPPPPVAAIVQEQEKPAPIPVPEVKKPKAHTARRIIEPEPYVEQERYRALFTAAEGLSIVASPESRVALRKTAGLFVALAAVQLVQAPNLELLTAGLVVSRTAPLLDIWRKFGDFSSNSAFKTAWRIVAKPMQVIAVARLHSGRMTNLARLAYCAQLALCEIWSAGSLDNARLAFGYAATLALAALLFGSTDAISGILLLPSLMCALLAANQSAWLSRQLAARPQDVAPPTRPRLFFS